MVGAVVVAAGASYRMGSPKALLKIGEKTFLQHIVDVLQSAGITEIVVVLGSNAEVIKESLNWYDGTVVLNRDWKDGQLSSIVAGLAVLRPLALEGALICPVDHPFITRRLLTDMLHVFRLSGKGIVVPAYGTRRGHPVIFASRMFDALRDADLTIGARKIVKDHPDDIEEVATKEEGVVLNIDTPEDYRRTQCTELTLPKDIEHNSVDSRCHG